MVVNNTKPNNREHANGLSAGLLIVLQSYISGVLKLVMLRTSKYDDDLLAMMCQNNGKLNIGIRTNGVI